MVSGWSESSTVFRAGTVADRDLVLQEVGPGGGFFGRKTAEKIEVGHSFFEVLCRLFSQISGVGLGQDPLDARKTTLLFDDDFHGLIW